MRAAARSRSRAAVAVQDCLCLRTLLDQECQLSGTRSPFLPQNLHFVDGGPPAHSSVDVSDTRIDLCGSHLRAPFYSPPSTRTWRELQGMQHLHLGPWRINAARGILDGARSRRALVGGGLSLPRRPAAVDRVDVLGAAVNLKLEAWLSARGQDGNAAV